MRLERWIILTPDEAEDLRDALSAYLAADEPDPGWHHHLDAGDAEITLAIEAGRHG